MLYSDLLEEENTIMEEQLSEPSKALKPHEIQVPLRSLMRPPVTLAAGSSVQAAIDLMVERRVGYALVVSENALVGIFGERDVLLKILNKQQVGDLTRIPVEEFMVTEPTTLHVDDSLDAAITEMAKGGHRHIPVVDDERRPMGMVSIRHIIAFLVEHFPQEILTLPPRPARQAMTARDGA